MIIDETERFESECKRYRYLLRRDISGGNGFAIDWGYGTMLMVNLF